MGELLDLDGADLERELRRIIKENPPDRRPWTQKEKAILKRLREERVPYVTIAKFLGRSRKSVEYAAKYS